MSSAARLQTEASAGPPPVVCVLVHGTWAPDAPWTQEGSPFQRQLTEKLGLPVEFPRLPWSGVNTHVHRLEAADRLRGLVRASLARSPQSAHFIIAHSHGGNVACYALQDEDLRRAVRGVVCMATPFLHVRPKRLPRGLLLPAAVTVLLSAFLGIAYSLHRPEDPSVWRFVVGVGLFALPAIGLLCWALVRRRTSRLRWEGLLTPMRRPEEFTARLAFPALGPDRLLAIRVSGDEASGALVASQFFVWLFGRTWSALSRAWSLLQDRVLVCVAWSFAMLALAHVLGVFPSSTRRIGGLVESLFILLGFFALVVGLASYAVLMLLFLMHAPVGLDAMLTSLRLHTTAEPTPPGEASVFHVGQPSDGGFSGLAHSAVYEDRRVIGFIASWIRSRVRQVSTETRPCARD